MKRIINLVTHMEAGGSQAAAIKLSKEMRERGIDAETWFIYKKSDTYIDEDKVSIIHDSAPTTLVDVFQIIRKLVKKFKENKPDGVISYTHYASTLGHIASAIVGIKNRVATMQNPVWTYPKFAKILNKYMGATGFYTKIISLSETVTLSCQKYPKSYKKHIKVVYNGFPARISKLTIEEAREKFKIDAGNDRILVNIGRLHPQKNHKLLIDVMRDLKGYKLIIAGQGELKDELNSKISELGLEDRVKLLGEIKPIDIPDFLRAGDVFVFPSIFEAFGIVLFEAGHNGIPVVASNIPSTVEVLSTGNSKYAGIIVKDMQPTNWINAIRSLEDKEEYAFFKEEIQKKSKEFDFDQWIDAYVAYATLK